MNPQATLAPLVAHLTAHDRSFALFGATALGAHGIPRATRDIDLLATAEALDRALWQPGALGSISCAHRPGDADDNLLGLVRVGPRRGQVDVVVPRGRWPRRALERVSQQVDIGGVSLPLVGLPDLVLAKVHAGGTLDVRDIIMIVEAYPARRHELIAHVDAEEPYLYGPARRGWRQHIRPLLLRI